MADPKRAVLYRANFGDAAVDGLLAGLAAGTVMAAYLVVVGWALGNRASEVLSRFSLSAGASPASGVLMHLSVAAVYGALYGLLWRAGVRFLSARSRAPSGVRPARFRRWTGMLSGLAYGAALFALAVTLILPGTNSPFLASPWPHLLIAHGLYGASLGVMMHKPF